MSQDPDRSSQRRSNWPAMMGGRTSPSVKTHQATTHNILENQKQRFYCCQQARQVSRNTHSTDMAAYPVPFASL